MKIDVGAKWKSVVRERLTQSGTANEASGAEVVGAEIVGVEAVVIVGVSIVAGETLIGAVPEDQDLLTDAETLGIGDHIVGLHP
jgi:hypothetical protein